MRIVLTCSCLIIVCAVWGQNITSTTLLSDTLNETSGLALVQGRLITHNDKGGEPKLYELDTLNGQLRRTVIVENATNVDWEDLCTDADHLYIGDMGNNDGDRTDLRIYKIPIQDYLNASNDTVSAQIIDFEYLEQTDFTTSPQATNFDAEALIALNDSLYLFSKNWLNNSTYVYALPTVPGSYQLTRKDSINSNGLVTGATYNPLEDKVLLIGYQILTPFVLEIGQFGNGLFSNGTLLRADLSVSGSTQTEGVVWSHSGSYHVTAEANFTGPASLYTLDNSALFTRTIGPVELAVYPNPTTDMVYLEVPEMNSGSMRVSVQNALGQEVRSLSIDLGSGATGHRIDMAGLPRGAYFIRMRMAGSIGYARIILE